MLLKYENFLQKNLIVSPIILLYTQVEKISLGNYHMLSFPTFLMKIITLKVTSSFNGKGVFLI